jgi:protease-4
MSTTTTGTTTVIVQPTRAGGSWFAWIALLICFALLMWNFSQGDASFDSFTGTTETYYAGSKKAKQKIAIISVEGTISSLSEGKVREQIERVRKDENVVGVVVRVNSPGGTVTGSDYICHHLKKLRTERNLPMVVSMGGIATSGGYYVSMAVGHEPRSIFAEPTTVTGSIGVIIPRYDLSGLLARFDIKDDSITTHPRKQMLSMTREMPEDHRALIVEYLQESLDRFKSIVREGRKAFAEDPAKLDVLATGEIFSANKAKANGLIDEIGFLEEAIAEVEKRAGLAPGEAKVVKYNTPPGLSDLLKLESNAGATELSIFGSPQAYYLCTTSPVLLSTWRALTENAR